MICAPRPSLSSTLWIVGADGDEAQRQQLPGLMSAVFAEMTSSPTVEALRREDVALLAVRVVEQRDARGAVRVVLDRRRPWPARRPCCA